MATIVQLKKLIEPCKNKAGDYIQRAKGMIDGFDRNTLQLRGRSKN
jgi:hypothetical protein